MDNPPGDWIDAQVLVPKGSHLAGSKATPGMERAILFGDAGNKMQGPPELRIKTLEPKKVTRVASPIQSAPSPFMDLAMTLAVTAVTQVAIEAAPVIGQFVSERVVPSIRARWVNRAKKRAHPAVVASGLTREEASNSFSTEIDVAFSQYRRDMSSEEAQQRVLAVMVAAAFIAAQLRELSEARIEGVDFDELTSAMNRLTTQEATDMINEILSSERSLLDTEAAHEFIEIYGSGRAPDGTFEPLTVEAVTDALSFDVETDAEESAAESDEDAE